ncbi:MAG: DsbA family protein, partial [Patescibacteria group bacterium]|nr:DsbA family protein [Patescibacteria group bacterium]
MENDAQNKPKDWLLPGSILAAAIIIAGSVIYSTGLKNYAPQDSVTASSTSLAQNNAKAVKISEADVILGDPSAPVTIVEFGDFQCPFCAKFFKEIEPQIRKN